jgi:hypothetical protein
MARQQLPRQTSLTAPRQRSSRTYRTGYLVPGAALPKPTYVQRNVFLFPPELATLMHDPLHSRMRQGPFDG